MRRALVAAAAAAVLLTGCTTGGDGPGAGGPAEETAPPEITAVPLVPLTHPDTFSTGLDWYLDDLFTDPAARGTGVASALIDRLTELARATGPGTLRWITAEDNVTAQRVYDRLAKRTTWVTYEIRA